MPPGMTIGNLAKKTDCQVETIRYYEREGLIRVPARSEGNYRLYGGEAVQRLRFIRHCRTLDMTLDEIRTLLQFLDSPDENCAQANKVLDEHIVHVSSRISELKSLEKQLKKLRSLCGTARLTKDCGILQELSGETRAAPKNLGSHGRSRH